ncbi:MAG: universal stress protein [Xanthomonadaceae bacterium]|jgi:nucleotide-binding universal stress UspA family protein|nr:universal stress protein [Xanthomonadaceae bacterium]
MRLLVPLDLSAATPAVLAAVRGIAAREATQVYLLHVAEPDPAFVGYEAGTDTVRDQVAHEYRGQHRDLQAHAEALRADGIAATALLIRGPVAQTILREAQRLPADLLVMATHGHGAVFDLLVGSVSHAVLRGTTVPLLLVPVRSR